MVGIYSHLCGNEIRRFSQIVKFFTIILHKEECLIIFRHKQHDDFTRKAFISSCNCETTIHNLVK